MQSWIKDQAISNVNNKGYMISGVEMEFAICLTVLDYECAQKFCMLIFF